MKYALRTTALVAAAVLFSFLSAEAAAPKKNCGHASWYALTSKTASGERMNAKLLTAAHKHYKFGTLLRVTNPKNGRAVVVRINDRGPFSGKRMLDLSKAAAAKIDLVISGVGEVCTQIVSS